MNVPQTGPGGKEFILHLLKGAGEMEVEMLELTSGEWEWVVAALEYFQNDPLLSWDEGERAELNTLFHKIKDGDV